MVVALQDRLIYPKKKKKKSFPLTSHTCQNLIPGNDKLIMISTSGKGRCEGLLTMKMKAEAIEPPIDTAKIVMMAFLGTSMSASGLSAASPPGMSGSESYSLSPEGSAIG